MLVKFYLFLFIFFSLVSCSTDETLDVDYSMRSDTKIYNDALNYLNDEKYEEAHELFTELDLQHPYSKWATKGQLMSGFSLYKANKYDESIFVLNKFINLNPNNPKLDYAYYLKGYCYYERINQVSRDQKVAEKAYNSFKELQNKFPNSIYSKKAKNHIALLINQLAGKEMSVGKYYQTRGKFLAGILRYKTILRKYKNSAQIPEALYRIIECYLSIGLEPQAIKLAAILGYNYPSSKWYNDVFSLIKKNEIKFKTEDLRKKNLLDIEKINIDDFSLER